MARSEAGKCSKAQEDYCSTESTTEKSTETDPITNTADSSERTNCWITQSNWLSRYGTRPETDPFQPGKTCGGRRRTSAGGQSYPGWFAKGTGYWG
jgi:hypothetical protein